MKSSMKYLNETINYRGLEIKIKSYNSLISKEELLEEQSIFLLDYIDFLKNNKSKDLIDFIDDSILNNHDLNDQKFNINFKIKEDHILFDFDCISQDFINFGEIQIGNYKINLCHSYFFIENSITKKQCLYYAD